MMPCNRDNCTVPEKNHLPKNLEVYVEFYALVEFKLSRQAPLGGKTNVYCCC